MSLLRRKKKGEGEDIEIADDTLDDDETGGMFISAGREPGAAAAASGPSAPEDGEDADGEVAVDDVDVDADEEAAGGPPDAGGEDAGADKEKFEVQTVSGGGEDDALALFQDVAAHSGLGDLTDDLDDMTIEELVADLREVRAMLPAVSVDAEDSTED